MKGTIINDDYKEDHKLGFHLIGQILLFPIRVLFFPFKLIVDAWLKSAAFDESYDLDAETGNKKGFRLFSRLGSQTRRFMMALVRLPIFILQAPFLILKAIFFGGKTELLLLLPSIVAVLFMGFVFFQVFAQPDRILNRYRIGARKAIEEGNLKLAKTYFNRVVKESKLSENDQLQWSMILFRTGEIDRSQQILDQLAPDDRSIYGPAHRMKAIAIATRLGNSGDPLTLRKLHHHLESSEDDSVQIKQAWASYFLAVDQPDNALDYLKAASEWNPLLLLTIAKIYERKGNTFQQNDALRKADHAFRSLVDKDPLNSMNRINLANVLVQMKKFDQAEQLLASGLKLQPDQIIKRATADFYVLGYDMAVQKGEDFTKQFAFLQQALAFDENHVAVYIRLVSLYQKKTNAAEAEKIKKALMESVAGDRPSAMAHFALSNVLWLEGNHSESEWHIEQAYKLQPSFAFVINNLAWMLAHKKEPDLDRALELAEMAVKQSPNDSQFLGTYGTVLFLKKEYEDAITQFQKAIPRNPDVKSIHAKLAVCYQQIGKPNLAEIHRQKANGE